MSRADDLRAELEVAELEDELVRLKGLKRSDQEKLHQVKHALREARGKHRETRAGAPVGEGDAVASPETIKTSVKVEETG